MPVLRMLATHKTTKKFTVGRMNLLNKRIKCFVTKSVIRHWQVSSISLLLLMQLSQRIEDSGLT